MAWRDQLQQGKFRDAEFFTEGADADIGRRNVLHEYPLRDLPYVEDLGRKAREFGLECFVIGADYMAARDRLIAAIEAEGPGTLVHPWLGSMRVSVRGCRVRESASEGGLAIFSVTFVEAGESRSPTATQDTRSVVQARADTAIFTAGEAFEEQYAVAGMPDFLAASSAAVMGDLLTELSALPGAMLPTAAAEFVALLGSASDALTSIVRLPSALAVQVTSLIGGIAGLYTAPLAALRAQRRLFDFGGALAAVPTTTYIRAQQSVNQAAMVRLVRRTAVIESARAVTAMEFASYNDAVIVRDELAEQLDAHMLEADDQTYPVLQSLRAAVIRDISARGANLARVISYAPGATLPALVVAHRLYGDATRESELVARNRTIRHPGFIQGGSLIEVLTDAA
jgi:prophage DNA circulation protein